MKCPDSAKTGYVYYSEETHKMEPELLKTWEALAEKYEKNWTDYEKQIWEETKASNTVNVHFLGISESVFDMLEWKGEKCSWDTFKSGDYVLVDYGDKYAEHPVSYYQTGDIFQMDYENGNQKDYGVIGEALMPYALDYPYATVSILRYWFQKRSISPRQEMNQPCMLPLMQRRARTSR